MTPSIRPGPFNSDLEMSSPRQTNLPRKPTRFRQKELGIKTYGGGDYLINSILIPREKEEKKSKQKKSLLIGGIDHNTFADFC